MRQSVTIRTPGPPTQDPVSGNEVPGAVQVVPSRAYLSQSPVGDIGSQLEILATQNTTISLWTLLVPKGTVLTSASIVDDSSGRRFQVVGQPADRPNRHPQFRAAALRLISDLQTS